MFRLIVTYLLTYERRLLVRSEPMTAAAVFKLQFQSNEQLINLNQLMPCAHRTTSPACKY